MWPGFDIYAILNFEIQCQIDLSFTPKSEVKIRNGISKFCKGGSGDKNPLVFEIRASDLHNALARISKTSTVDITILVV